jgi:hypothetical protein
MKKIYSLIAAVFIGYSAFSQCTPNPALFGAANNTNYTIIPDTVTNLPVAYVGLGYNTDLQFHIQPDTVTSLGTFPITQVQIDSVSGIPAGFSYIPNPSSGTFTTPTHSPPGTGYGCVAVTGLATAGEETGGPAANGVYPLIVYYTGTVVIFSQPTPMPATKTGYKLVIMPANGISTFEASHFSVAQNSPNPSNDKTNFLITAPTGGNVNFTIYNMLGSVVKEENISATKGTNEFSLETSSLSDGVYMCSFRQGSAIITRRITVSH